MMVVASSDIASSDVTIIGRISPAMPVEPCRKVVSCPSSPEGYRHRIRYGEPTAYRIAQVAEQELEAAWQVDCETHEKNKPAIAHNTALRERIGAVMKAAGIPDHYSEIDTNSRSRFPKRVRRQAGYLDDLARSVPIDDGFEQARQTYERLRARYAEYRKRADEEKAAAERAEQARREAELRQRQADMELAVILVRYNLPVTSTWADVLGALRGRNKYLDLALAMEQVHGDWSDGYDPVSRALQRFPIEDDRDKDIAADILGCIADLFGDGRVFRDTTWNYDRLYEIVPDQQLVADARRALAGAVP